MTGLVLPPRMKNYRGSERRVGVELEFAALSARQAAELVASTFGGRIETLDPHRFRIVGTEVGDFETELDTRFAHPEEGPRPTEWAEADEKIREWIGDFSSYWVPCEVVSPPILLSRLPAMDRLLSHLSAAGAEGTRASPIYAFALQLNPEVAATDAPYLLSILRAYVVLSEWLRAEIALHITRILLPFANPFPADYAQLLCDPSYAPDLPGLIDDYLAFNPTRNRELDMLPLFAWLDRARVEDAVSDVRVKARPTFHYRLPDARVGEPDWSIVREWNRWVQVETLADDSARLHAVMAAYRAYLDQWLPGNWAAEARRWLTP